MYFPHDTLLERRDATFLPNNANGVIMIIYRVGTDLSRPLSGQLPNRT